MFAKSIIPFSVVIGYTKLIPIARKMAKILI